MQERYIKLNSVEDIKTFVRAAENCPFDIDVNYNRVYIDGKSFLGLMGMDLNQILRVQFSGNDAAFEAMPEGFAAGKNSAA